MKIIYLDNASTTRVYDEVVEEMNKFHLNEYGNPSNSHELGEIALKAVNEARKKIALELGCKAEEIIFTSGATESNNLALFGIVKTSNLKRIFISSIEHSSVYEVVKELGKKEIEAIEVPVDKYGLLDVEFLDKFLKKGDLVSVIHGHNEIGVLQNIGKIGKICRKKGAIFHIDASQSFGKEKINVNEMNINLLSASGHKIHASKGIGILFVKNGVKIEPLIYGGHQEKGIRAGTENVAGIVGIAKALELVKKADKDKIKGLRNYFIEKLEEIGGKINGSKDERLYNNVHISFNGIDADELVIKLSMEGIMCSSRSACLTKQKNENRILRAIGLTEKESKGSLRFVLSEWNTKKEIDYVLKNIKDFI